MTGVEKLDIYYFRMERRDERKKRKVEKAEKCLNRVWETMVTGDYREKVKMKKKG